MFLRISPITGFDYLMIRPIALFAPLAMALSVYLSGCAHDAGGDKTAAVSGINTENFDRSVRPQDDFYAYVNGGWINSFDIPADMSRYGAFDKLAEAAREDVKALIETSAKQENEPGSDAQKIGDLYASFMNEEQVNQASKPALAAELARINDIKTRADFTQYLAYALVHTRAPFSAYVYIDDRNPTEHITFISQGGLGLPDRDYYIKGDEKSRDIQNAYLAHIQASLVLAGIDNAAMRARKIYAMEKSIADVHWPKTKLRDPVARYNRLSKAALKATNPAFDWQNWLDAAQVGFIDEIVVRTPEPLTKTTKLITSLPLETLKDYQRWHLIRAFSPYLGEEFEALNFAFYGKKLNGIEVPRDRWKRAVALIDDSLGEAVGKLYVEKHFPPRAKQKMTELVENLRTAYGKSIRELDWMGEETKEQALEKLAKFNPKIGYPDEWKDYSSLTIDQDDLIGNVKRANEFQAKENLAKLGQPIDRNEWFMTPQTVNAYYNPTLNEIVFPAAILQPPFFFLDADPAVNYGAIGAVIGHEMGHGFDDSGSQFDGDGALRNWWTDDDRKAFETRTSKLVELYDSFKVFPDLSVNGEFTQGENIGDLSGLTIGLKAYELSLDGQAAPVIDGMTGTQRVLYGWAQVWASKYREEALRLRVKTDPHSPAKFRTNGIVMNVPEFYEAFNVQPGDQLYLPEDQRVKIW